jgi:hypothetical protein
VTIPKPPDRCPHCGAYDSWGEVPRPIRIPGFGGPEYRDVWTCGICWHEWHIPMPVHLDLRVDRGDS